MARKKTPRKGRAGARTSTPPAEVASVSRRDVGTLDTRTMGELLDEQRKVERAREWFIEGIEASTPWRDRHIENMRFLSNEQWSEEDKARLADQGRPALVINKMTNIIVSVSGLQRRARQDIAVVPAEPGDISQAAIMERLVKFVRERNRARKVSSDVFMNKIASGIGFWKLQYDFRDRPQGEIDLECVDPLSIVWDPNWPRQEWSECEWVIHAEWFSLDQAIEDWPEHESTIRAKYGEWANPAVYGSGERIGDDQASRRHFWDAQTQKMRIMQVWYKSLERVKLAVFADGQVIDEPTEVEALEDAVRANPDLADGLVITTRPMRRVHLMHQLDDLMLDERPTPLPFQEFPIFPSIGYFFWQWPIGMCDLMKDPQREKNKRRTVITEIAGRTAHSGWLNKRDGGADPEELENFVQGNGNVVHFDEERPIPIDPPEISQVLVYLENKSDAEIGESVNYNAELSGQKTNSKTVSGKAVEARQQGGLVSQEVLFDSFAEEEANMTRYMIEMIKDLMTPEEALRILGGATQDPEVAQDVALALSSAFSVKYDVVISNKPFSATHALYAFNQFLDMLAKGIPVPPQLLVKAATESGVVDKAGGQEWLEMLGPGPVTGTPPGGAQPMPEVPETAGGVNAAQAG